MDLLERSIDSVKTYVAGLSWCGAIWLQASSFCSTSASTGEVTLEQDSWTCCW